MRLVVPSFIERVAVSTGGARPYGLRSVALSATFDELRSFTRRLITLVTRLKSAVSPESANFQPRGSARSNATDPATVCTSSRWTSVSLTSTTYTVVSADGAGCVFSTAKTTPPRTMNAMINASVVRATGLPPHPPHDAADPEDD